jgi:hypothetical protein
MVYASPINLITPEDSKINILQDPPYSKKSVRVYYNDVAIDSITGPVPIVDMSTDYNTTVGGVAQSTTTKIGLNGKILRTTYYDPEISPSGTGTKILVEAMDQLKNLFKCNNGIVSIKCGSDTILSGSGVQVKSVRFDKSNDNWIFSSDYFVELEYSEPLPKKVNEPLIKTGSDSWSLEPLDNYIYMSTKLSNSIAQKAEYHNQA